MTKLIHADCIEAMSEMDEASVDAIVTDPPYGLGFMGKKWDDLPPGPAFAEQALRVLKPGGHLLAFGGSRTYHRLAVAIEDAGFEIRDCLMWLYGSGFPKSLDVSKAIDRRGGVVADFAKFRDAVIAAMDKGGIKRKEVEAALGNFMLSHYLTKGSQPAVPNLRDYRVIRDFVGLGDRFDKLFQEEAKREVVGKKKSGIANKDEGPRHTIGASKAVELDITAPATDAAKEWEGWGTALKPAHEPIVLARKPLEGTVAANVQKWGTGGLNIDGCRIGAEGGTTRNGKSTHLSPSGAFTTGHDIEQLNAGRWPANLAFDETAAEMLDEQSGTLRRATSRTKRSDRKFAPGTLEQSGTGSLIADGVYPDTGGASRFFYCAKASKSERNAGLTLDAQTTDDGRKKAIDNPYQRGKTQRQNHHPTVKPISLMRWLVRLVTPPNGTVLDPFLGSGTTGCAAAIEGCDFIGIEREAEYLEIAQARIDHWRKQPQQESLV